jgi:hypothetical protein
MNMVKRIALAASILLAMTFALGCSDDKDDKDYKWCVWGTAPNMICTELSIYKTSTTMTLGDCDEGKSLGYRKAVDLPEDCMCIGPSCEEGGSL